MEGPWLGLFILVAMVVGLVWRCIWVFRKDKKESVGVKEAGSDDEQHLPRTVGGGD